MKSAKDWSAEVRKPRYSLLDVTLAIAVVGVVSWYSVNHFRRQLIDIAFVSPIPRARAAMEKLVPDSEAYLKKYDFTTNWFTYDIPVWDEVMAHYKGKPDLRYLEIGVYEGRSALWMLEKVLTHPTARLTAIDLFDGPYKDRFLSNLERSGSGAKVTTIAEPSQVALRGLGIESFDIIYIDGSHAKDDVLEDAVLSFRLLKKGGLLIFDDYRWAGIHVTGTCDAPTDFPKTAIDRFYECFSNHFDVIHNSYQLILRKKG